MHGTVATVLTYLGCLTYIVFMVVFTFVGGIRRGSDLLVCLFPTVNCCCLLLLLLII